MQMWIKVMLNYDNKTNFKISPKITNMYQINWIRAALDIYEKSTKLKNEKTCKKIKSKN